jgi:hypothetical protein
MKEEKKGGGEKEGREKGVCVRAEWRITFLGERFMCERERERGGCPSSLSKHSLFPFFFVPDNEMLGIFRGEAMEGGHDERKIK